jgi:hypothetical protein
MYILKADDEFELVAKCAIKAECHATPAVSEGQLFIRTATHLLCIGQGQ